MLDWRTILKWTFMKIRSGLDWHNIWCRWDYLSVLWALGSAVQENKCVVRVKIQCLKIHCIIDLVIFLLT